METVYIITFESTNNSLMLYKLIKNSRLKVTMIQTPCRLSAGCARSLEIKEFDIAKVVEIIKDNGIEIGGIYKKFINPKTRRYEYAEASY